MRADASTVAAAVASAYRHEWAQVLATVVRVARDFDIAEDCVQDAFAQAVSRWERDGIPDRPGAWLTTVAVREALQGKRRAATAARNLPALVIQDGDGPADPAAGTVFQQLPDDRLRLIFTCCHPALAPQTRVALTLRMVCGLSSAEVAKAFLVKDATMQARLTRAKKKIAEAAIPYRAPTATELPERLESVFDVVHLVYNAGHVAPAGDTLMRVDLADRALQVARMLHDLMPDDGESAALLAMLLLTEARRSARVDTAGLLVPLDEQDRTLWDRGAIAEGLTLLHNALNGGARGRYAVMACIAAVHAEAATADETDWHEIVRLYEQLLRRWPTAVVALNRAIAVGAAYGPGAGLAALDRLDRHPDLAEYPYLPAARADFLRRLGRHGDAAAAYRDALSRTGNAIEATFLERRLAEVCATR